MSLLQSHGPEITREHVWPDWLRDYLPPFDEDADIERWSPGTSRQGWSQPFLTTTVRALSNGCNSGWMADIEAAAKPIVGPMVIGQPPELDAGAQQIVANWVALKGLVAAQASKLARPADSGASLRGRVQRPRSTSEHDADVKSSTLPRHEWQGPRAARQASALSHLHRPPRNTVIQQWARDGEVVRR